MRRTCCCAHSSKERRTGCGDVVGVGQVRDARGHGLDGRRGGDDPAGRVGRVHRRELERRGGDGLHVVVPDELGDLPRVEPDARPDDTQDERTRRLPAVAAAHRAGRALGGRARAFGDDGCVERDHRGVRAPQPVREPQVAAAEPLRGLAQRGRRGARGPRLPDGPQPGHALVGIPQHHVPRDDRDGRLGPGDGREPPTDVPGHVRDGQPREQRWLEPRGLRVPARGQARVREQREQHARRRVHGGHGGSSQNIV
ncbi:hypothetical protein CPER28S_02361 [Cellulomonas persica]